MTQPIHSTHLAGFPVRRGKVRDVYDLGDRLLIVATDRISAFDCVLPTPIPDKGRILTALSDFWFARLARLCPHHLIEIVHDRAPPGLDSAMDMLRGRAMLCRKAEVIPIECVARGYLAGSGWNDYLATGTLCGVRLPSGLRRCDRLPAPVFTPATKEESGHDRNISYEEACDLVGADAMATLRDRTLALYSEGAEYARERGIIIADTKFEFGRTPDGIILIDEVLTPDSSRFWPADRYAPGREQDSFDKQFVRNHLQGLCDAGQWDKRDPAPALPPDVVESTRRLYLEAYRRITGEELAT